MQKNWQTNIALMGTLSFFLIACEASISITPGPSSRGTNSGQGSTSTTNPGSTQQTAPKTTQQPTTPPRETKRVCTQRQQWKTQLSPTKPQETFSSSFWLSPQLDKDTKGTDIATDAQGNIYITGYTLETSPYAPPNSDESYKATMFVAKISTQGQIMWVLSPTTQSSKKISRGYAITVDKQGYVYVVGDFWKTTTFGADRLTAKHWDDLFVSKMSADGCWLWTVSAGGSHHDKMHAIAADTQGNLYVTGQFSSSIQIGKTTHTSPGSMPHGFIAKLTKEGHWAWSKQIDNGHPKSIVVGPNGHIYTTGVFLEKTSIGGSTFSSTKWTDVYVAKLNADGNWLWAVQAGGVDQSESAGLTVDTQGNVYFAASVGSPNQDTSQQTVTMGSHRFAHKGKDDIVVAKLDTHGQWKWAKHIASHCSDSVNDITIDQQGKLKLVGKLQCSVTFGTKVMAPRKEDEAFIATLTTEGKWLQIEPLQVDNRVYPKKLAIGKDGKVYTIGDQLFASTVPSVYLSNAFIWSP